MSEWQKVRIRFAKYGALKFVGHLDIMRFFQKAIRRAGVCVRYSEGYHPHQIMAFAAPLGMCLESVGEYFDIETEAGLSVSEIMTALQETMVEGVRILDACILPDHAQNAMACVSAAAWRVFLPEEESGILSEQNVSAFMAQTSVFAEKKTKKGLAEAEIRPDILECRYEQATQSLYMLLSAGSHSNLKPETVLHAYRAFCGVEKGERLPRIIRLETYQNVTDEEGQTKLMPLIFRDSASLNF